MPEFTSVAKAGEVPEGEGRVIKVDGVDVALFHLDGEYYAIDNTCVHRGGPLGEGMCDGIVVTCPWHGWQYDVTSGECQNVPGEGVESYEVRIEGDDVQVKVG